MITSTTTQSSVDNTSEEDEDDWGNPMSEAIQKSDDYVEELPKVEDTPDKPGGDYDDDDDDDILFHFDTYN